VPDLIRLLFDRQPEVRVVAAGALAAAPPTSDVVLALLGTIDSDRRVPAGLVADTLLRLGPEATPPLAHALAHGTPNVRAVAAETLGLLDTTQATEALLAALGDPDDSDQPDQPDEVRIRAAGALGRIGAPGAFEPLVACLMPAHAPPLQVAAVQALGLLGRPGAVPYLLPMLTGAHVVAAAAALALTRLGPPGVAALDEVADQDGDSSAARYAASALATLRLAGDHAGRGTPVSTG
jgi:HEAT repeat protein